MRTLTRTLVFRLAAGVVGLTALGACSSEPPVYLSCQETAKKLTGGPGTEYTVECPQKCAGGTVYGTDIYTDDSAICVAAVHQGLINASGGKLKVTIADGQPNYAGSERNGIRTSDWKTAWGRSFKLDN